MPTLPTSRVTESRPFLRVGLDYMGPMFVKTNGDHKKACLVTRGVHLEIVQDLSTVEFLLCLRGLSRKKVLLHRLLVTMQPNLSLPAVYLIKSGVKRFIVKTCNPTCRMQESHGISLLN
jgi:hypothetical protein